MIKLLHLGIPTEKKVAGKVYNYVEAIKLHVTNPDADEFKLQYVWAEPDSPLPEIVRQKNHLSIGVESIEDVLSSFDQVAFPPHAINDKLRICFALKDDVLFELMEFHE
jgi:hypothetical protein